MNSGRHVKLLALAVIAVVVCAVAITGAVPAAADSLGDKIVEARVKARTGNVEEALADLDALKKDHPDDPRVHYYRSKFLWDLERQGEAGDALEAADAALKKYEAGGGKAPDILGLKDAIASDSKEVLKYRMETRKLLDGYRSKALPLVRALLKEGKPYQASYVLAEISAAAGEDDVELQELRKEVDAAIRESGDGE